MPRGSKPGERRGGRKPGQPNKATADIKEAAREYSADALRVLVDVAMNGDSAAARVSAANAILDRAHGKPTQAVEMDATLKATFTEFKRTIIDPQHRDAEGLPPAP